MTGLMGQQNSHQGHREFSPRPRLAHPIGQGFGQLARSVDTTGSPMGMNSRQVGSADGYAGKCRNKEQGGSHQRSRGGGVSGRINTRRPSPSPRTQ